MYRRASKKREIVKRVAVYLIMTFSVLIIVTGLIFVTLGYRFDIDNGHVEQGALLQFATIPSGATIEIDGSAISSKTPAKNSVLAGSHSFVMRRDGYETWQKTLDIKAGTLTWLNYARLVPKKKTVSSVAQYTALRASMATADGRFMVVQQDGVVPTFQLVNLQSDEVKTTTLTIPTTLYSEAATAGVVHDFRLDQWDESGRYLLVQHTYGTQKEWLVLDTRNVNATANITTALDLDIASIKFAGTSGSNFFALSGGDIRKLDLSAGTISRSFVTGVASFDLFDTNIITYVGKDAKDATKQVAGFYKDGDSSAHVIRTSTGTPLKIATSRYFNQDYIAVIEGEKVTILGGSYPTSDDDKKSMTTYGTFAFAGNVDLLSFSPSGDYVLVQSGSNFTSYDIEHKKVYPAVVVANATTAVGPLKWLDDNQLWSDYNSDTTMREFDGANVHTINKSVVGQAVTLSENGRYLYSVGKTDAGYQLQRVRMILQ